MKRSRNCLSYKIRMWYYRLTFKEIKKVLKMVFSFVLKFVITLIGFALLFIFPALFH